MAADGAMAGDAVGVGSAVAVATAQARLHARDALIRNPLHQADVELNLIPDQG